MVPALAWAASQPWSLRDASTLVWPGCGPSGLLLPQWGSLSCAPFDTEHLLPHVSLAVSPKSPSVGLLYLVGYCQLLAAGTLKCGWTGVPCVLLAVCRLISTLKPVLVLLSLQQNLIDMSAVMCVCLCSYYNNHKSIFPAVSQQWLSLDIKGKDSARGRRIICDLLGCQWRVNSEDESFQGNRRANSSLGELNFSASWSSILLAQTGMILSINQAL